MIRVAIVEDDRNHAESLHLFLKRFGKERNQEFSVDFFDNGMDFVSDYNGSYEIVLMDIEMPHMNGMDCAFRLRRVDRNVIIVFVTSMVQYAVKGYEVGAMGFVVKPIEYFSFTILMDKILEKIETESAKELFIRSGDHARRLSSRDIYYIEVMDHYLIYHTVNGDFRETGKLTDVELQLGDSDFFRCGKSYLVNLRYVREVGDNEVTVGNDKLLISRRRKKGFLLAVNSFFRRGGGV